MSTQPPLFDAPADPGAVRDRVTLSARVPRDLRAQVLEHQARRGDPDVSATVRHLLALGLSLGDGTPLPGPGDLFKPREGVSGTEAPSTSKRAAAAVRPRSGSQRHLVLQLVEDQGLHGLTAEEAGRTLRDRFSKAWPQSGVSARVNELVAAGAVEPLRFRERLHLQPREVVLDGVVCRPTAAGSHARVLVITEHGERWLQELADQACAS